MTFNPQIRTLEVEGQTHRYVAIADIPGVEQLPFSLRIVLENVARQAIRGEDVERQVHDLLARRVGAGLSFYPGRIFGQDILGQVMLVDMAALRDAVAEQGRDPSVISPKVPIDIIIDHSLQVDRWAHPDAAHANLAREYERNGERFAFLRWCSTSFDRVRVVPPGKGIMHQIHIENIGRVVWLDETPEGPLLSPDTCVGTDSHTPMINALGVLGWGVGGIEAEAVMVGKPVAIALPEVIGVEVSGILPHGTTPTDLVLTITEKLRALGVVGKFVEFFGPGVDVLTLGDRGTIANMAPEYGATAVYFPIDRQTIDYLRMTGRTDDHVAMVETYARVQRLWRDETTPAPVFDTIIHVDLAAVRPCIAGPRNPEDRIDLEDAAGAFPRHAEEIAARAISNQPVPVAGADFSIKDGDVVIAAITSCTNTSSPSGMITAGLLARNAVARGLVRKPWVKTSLAPGSHVVSAILETSGLQHSLDRLGFNVVGFGCTTCNGGSGPLPEAIAEAIESEKLVATAVLSGNRNFQGRIHPNVRAAYLASPALVIAYAIAGSMLVDVARDPLGHGADGKPVYLADIWPTAEDVARVIGETYEPEVFRSKYAELFDGDENWKRLAMAGSKRFGWHPASTYLRRPPYFEGLAPRGQRPADIIGIRPLCILGDSITTDHISPSGAISLGTPAADFLLGKGVEQKEFNNYTTRRGNHEVAVRATFANIRLRNHMVPGVEGGVTALQPDATVMRIFEAAEEYRRRGVPLAIIAGRMYGSGSSRDWAAKGVALLGVKVVIAQSFERIHRTNLVGMGVLPLQFDEDVDWRTLGLVGTETFDFEHLAERVGVRSKIPCTIHRADGLSEAIELTVRLDTEEDLSYWQNGGILPTVWRNSLNEELKAS